MSNSQTASERLALHVHNLKTAQQLQREENRLRAKALRSFPADARELFARADRLAAERERVFSS